MYSLFEIEFPSGDSFIGSTDQSLQDFFARLGDDLKYHKHENVRIQAFFDKYKTFKFHVLEENIYKWAINDKLSKAIREKRDRDLGREPLIVRPFGYADSHRPDWHKWVYGGYDNPNFRR